MSEESLNNSTSSSKIYLDVVEKLRGMIEADGLSSGDKIPSERELSERLKVGRSSVREALRALELLGLIETRRGEGTYIKDFQEHRLVELLGTFFLQNDKVKIDLSETKRMIEINCLQTVLLNSSETKILELLNWLETAEFDDTLFFQKIAMLNSNRLMERIWRIVNSYAIAALGYSKTAQREDYIQLIQALIRRNEQEVLDIYIKRIRNLSKSV